MLIRKFEFLNHIQVIKDESGTVLWEALIVSVTSNTHNYKYMFLWCLVLNPRRQWHPTPVLLPKKSHGQRSLVGCSPWGRESQTQLSNFTLTFHFHALEKEMATHFSVLAWRIPGTGKPGGLQSMGSHRVEHDWSDLAVILNVI